MTVHISLFYLKDPADADKMTAALKEVPKKNSAIVTSYVGKNHTQVPEIPGVPDFADVAQVITFATAEDAAGYESSQAHLELRAATDDLVKRVAAAEFVQ